MPMEEKTLDIVLDVKVKVTVQLGSCLLPMRDVLELAPGSVVQLHQHASDPVGLYVNDKLVAYGEVVVVEDNFGIKITELVGSRARAAMRAFTPGLAVGLLADRPLAAQTGPAGPGPVIYPPRPARRPAASGQDGPGAGFSR